MFIVSPKWIYFNNNKLEIEKSILIDGPIIIDILKKCFAKKLENKHCKENLLKMIPTHDEDLSMPHMAERQLQINEQSMHLLHLL